MGSFKKGFSFTGDGENCSSTLDVNMSGDAYECTFRIDNCCEIVLEKKELEELINRLIEMSKDMGVKLF